MNPSHICFFYFLEYFLFLAKRVKIFLCQFFSQYGLFYILHCFLCRRSDFTVSEDSG